MQSVTSKATGLDGFCLASMAALIPITLGILTPVLPTILETFKGVENSGLQVGLIAGAPMLVAALFGAPAGFLVDKVGPKVILLLGLIGYAALGCLPYIVDTLPLIVLLRFSLGFPLIMAIVASTAMIAGAFDGKARNLWLGMQSAIGCMFAVLTAIAGGALGAIGWQVPFLVHAIAIAWFIAVLPLISKPIRFGTDLSAATPAGNLDWGRLTTNLAMTAFINVVLLTGVIQVSFLLAGFGVTDPREIGNFIAIVSVGSAVGSLASPFITFISPSRKVLASVLLATCGLIAMATASTLIMAVVGATIVATGAGSALPTLIGAAVETTHPSRRGQVSGLWTSSMFIGQFINPPLFALFGGDGSFAGLILALALVCIMLSFALIVRRLID